MSRCNTPMNFCWPVQHRLMPRRNKVPPLLLMEAGYQVSKKRAVLKAHCSQIRNTSDHKVGQWTSICSQDSTTGGKGFEGLVEIAYSLLSPELRESGTLELNPQTNPSKTIPEDQLILGRHVTCGPLKGKLTVGRNRSPLQILCMNDHPC